MSVAEHHPQSASRGHVLMALIAFLLAVTAAYLWLTDGSPSLPLRMPAPASRAQVAPAPSAPTPKRVVHTAGAPIGTGARGLTLPVDESAVVDDEAPAASGPPPPQIAIDAAAAGMTARVRPAPVNSNR